MSDICSISFALDPTNVPTFLLDWEVTKLCNLDCTYCIAGHDNSTAHPPLADCLKSIDFMYEYVDQYMRHIKQSQRKVVLNVYGGESLFHPDIVEILEQVRQRYEPYRNSWFLTVTCTTNGIIGNNLFKRIVPLIDNFSMSYHAENLPKQRAMYFDNLLELQQQRKPFTAIVMMHNNEELWPNSQEAVEFCKEHKMKYVVKPVDNVGDNWKYTNSQLDYMKIFWMTKEPTTDKSMVEQGRSCCGGRKLSTNGNLKESIKFVPKQGFKGWSCSVNWYFLFVDQQQGLVYTNKDCMTSTTGRVEPLGTLQASDKIITTLKEQFATEMPVITCVKDVCRCGFCAPKAESLTDFRRLMTRYTI